MQQVHEIQERLADQFPDAEVHDLGFVVREFGQTRVELRPGVNLETQAVRLAGLQDESRHAHRAFQTLQRLRFGTFRYRAGVPRFR